MVTKEEFTKFEAEKEETLSILQKEIESLHSQLAKKEEAFQLELKEKEDIISSNKIESVRKLGVIADLNHLIDEGKQKIADLNKVIVDLNQEINNLTEEKKTLEDAKEHLEFSVAEVEMRAQMELMIVYKNGKHLNWDPDAIIKEYHATFPDPSSPLVNEPMPSPTEEDNAMMGDTTGNTDAADPPQA